MSLFFVWSFVFWGLGIYLSQTGNLKLLENFDLFKAILDRSLSDELLKVALLNGLAGYGPFLGAILLLIFKPRSREYFKNKVNFKVPVKYTLQILVLFLLITLIPSIPFAFKNGLANPLSWSLFKLFFLFFLYQLISAGSEEIGWRGFLLPSMLKTKTPWQASVNIGIIWALWHTPIILYVFMAQGIPVLQIILSFLGFIAGTIAMSTVHTYYYLKTSNLLFNVFIHAIANTLPMFVGILFSSSYEVSVGVQGLLWIFVFAITKKNKELFDTVAKDVSR